MYKNRFKSGSLRHLPVYAEERFLRNVKSYIRTLSMLIAL